MSLFILTTTFPGGLLDSPSLLQKSATVREAYRKAAPSFSIVSSYKVGDNETFDIVESSSLAEAKAGAQAIEGQTGTTIDVKEITAYNHHLQALAKR